MRYQFVKGLMVAGLVVAMSAIGYAQEASVTGTVTDSTGAVLPGVTVKAVHTASGNSFETVTDARGAYRIPLRTGVSEIRATLQGFADQARTVEVLVGQVPVVNLQLSPSSVEESVIVTAEAPLLNITQSSLGGNVDPRQVRELPVNGRNWQDLTMLAPGSRSNAVTDSPLPRSFGDYQLNVDGQQVTNTGTRGGGVQPRYSQDSIAEFAFVANRFDATSGRSSGAQVNVVTKSGTNVPSGMFSGYFRDDKFNSADSVAKTVLPYSDQQISTTYGGPLVQDKFHFFANYEFERNPQTFVYTTPYAAFNQQLTGTNQEHKAGARLDAQLSSRTHVTFRENIWSLENPYNIAGGATSTISSAQSNTPSMHQGFWTLTQVMGSKVHEVKGGYQKLAYSDQKAYTTWSKHPLGPGVLGAPVIQMTGFTMGQTNTQTPQHISQNTWQLRDDFTSSFDARGRHVIKTGGEYIHLVSSQFVCVRCMGVIDATGGARPANLASFFPDLMNVDTWNLAALSNITRSYSLNIGRFNLDQSQNKFGAWLQDDWTVSPKLTLNLGLRYDNYGKVYAQDKTLVPFLTGDRRIERLDFQPRLGFAYTVTPRTVIRGGGGKYVADMGTQQSVNVLRNLNQFEVLIPNDGRADFAANPFNGPAPKTFAEALLLPHARRSASQLPAPNLKIPYSYQGSIGLQQQVGETTGFQIDFVYDATRDELVQANINLSYDPATGANYPSTDVTRAPFPEWGVVNMYLPIRSNYKALQTALTKRFSNKWQASATYTLSALYDSDPPAYSGLQRVPFAVGKDLGGEYSLADTDQRHRVVTNGIWEVARGFQLSGSYFFGSGYRFVTTYGGDGRRTGVTNGRLRPDGSIVPRNNFVGAPIHRVNLRVQQQFTFGRLKAAGMLDVFNLFNHANYGSYTTQESNANYGKPTQNANSAYSPRMLQLGFRITF